ncbi:IS3 family transposase, partial [Bacillus pseudomycoides]|nr:IS3 family transposase [Bacillus pseudomycoides]
KCCQTFQSLQLVIEKYMQDYNYDRYQWTLKKMAPVQYRNHLFECLIFKGLFIKLSIL